MKHSRLLRLGTPLFVFSMVLFLAVAFALGALFESVLKQLQRFRIRKSTH